MHSEQWYYSLHRDFQNCYSTRRSPTGFFNSKFQFSKGNSNSTRVHHTPSTPTRVHTTLHIHPENSPSRNTILHAEDKELFEYYITDTRNSTHRRQGDLLEMHPCVLQDLPVTFQAFQPQVLTKATPVTPVTPIAPETFQSFQSSRHSSLSRHSRDIPDIPVIHDLPAFPGNSSNSANSTSSSISRDSTPLQHSPTRMHILQFLQILQFDWFPQKTPPSTS